ncbi:MAG: RHS repeat-associated core domain-containing protein [Betaproteobacteria bacterium]
MFAWRSFAAAVVAVAACAVSVPAARADTLTVGKAGSGAGTVTSNIGAINCGTACSDSFVAGAVVTLGASPAVGSRFSGWLGACTGDAACQVTMSGTVSVIATFAPASIGVPSLDIDGNGQFDALTDGLLVIRHLFGLSGASLINGAIGSGATRNTAAAIEGYLADTRPTLDIDGNGQVDALSDGLMIIRYLFGLRATSLITGVVGPGAIRTTAAAIEDVLAGLIAVVSGLPPDPATIAPPVDPTVPTALIDATAFLYTGPNPIQTGVAPGTITAERAAVLRGKVQKRDGTVLPAVKITLLGHPEFGQTQSRADGIFDIVVNGGGALTVRYEKTGFLPIQRTMMTPWRDYAWLPDVVMIPLDPAITAINLAAPGMQVARGSTESDADGARRATVLFPAGTTAMLVMANGSTQPLTSLSVRATEYTVGPTGPRAMPGALPPSSGYTYAVELSIDEGIAAGAADVRFNQPLPVYVENFLGFPVGGAVPAGYYDRQLGRWIASANGRVIKVLGSTGGLADLAIDGAGLAANPAALAALGITADERTRLAQLYPAAQTLWRVPVTHFTPWDCNWPFGPPPDSAPPPQPNKKPPVDKPNTDCGSVVGCEEQTLGESIALAGLPWRMHYQSERTPGSKASLVIPLSDATPLPASLTAIRVEVSIAGRLFTQSFAPSPNLSFTVNWDGVDSYGRTLQGELPAFIKLFYDYVPQYYAVSANFQASFARAEAAGLAVASARGASVVTLAKAWTDSVRFLDSRALGFGGWSLSVQHAYNPVSHTLLLGDGRQRRADALAPVIATVAGTGVSGFSGDGGTATQAQISYGTAGVATAADGSLYIADYGNGRIRRVAPDGTITTVAGSADVGFGGDGGPATSARLFSPVDVAVGPDGSFYIADLANNRVRRVGPDGIITTVAGTGEFGSSGDGGPAVAAKLFGPWGIAVSAEGNLYISDSNNNRIRRVGPDGIITTVAGTGVPGFGGDEGPASVAKLSFPVGLALGPDGSVFVADYGNNRVRRLTPDGRIKTVTGTGTAGSSGDGGSATDATLNGPYDVAIGTDGSVYVSDSNNYRIRRVGPDGRITTAAGTGIQGLSGIGEPAAASKLYSPQGLAVKPDGTLLVSDQQSGFIRSIAPAFPGVRIPSEDGSEVFAFDSAGRHLKTFDALTGALLYQFGYSAGGYLAQITDGSGNVTSIVRSGAAPTSIVAPGGQQTTLSVNANGWLQSAANPANQTHALTYSPDGLLQTLTDPRGNVHDYTYDGLGRLTKDEDAAGGSIMLARTEQADGYTVTTTSALGRTHLYQLQLLGSGALRRTVTAPSGATTISLINTDGSEQTTFADGTITTVIQGPDPRFGMQAPIVKSVTVSKPGSVTATRLATRSVTLADPADLLSLTAQTDTITVNGKVYTSTYSAATRTVTSTTPAGRQSVTTLDAQGHVVLERLDASLAPQNYSYDGSGLLTQAAQGVQSWTFGYDAARRLNARTDAAGGSTTYAYDAAGRPTQVSLPSGRAYGFSHDANGNQTQLIMPSLGIHANGYTAADREGAYTPPGNGAYVTSYDADARTTQVVLPSGRTESFTYDPGARLSSVSYPEATLAFAYAVGDPTARISRITRTPTGAGPAQEVQFSYGGDLVTGVNLTGAAVGQYAYTYDSNYLVASITLSSGVDNLTTTLLRDNDGLLTAAGPFAFDRAGPAGAVSQISDGTVAITVGYDISGHIASRSLAVGGVQKHAVQFTYDTVGRIASKSETTAGAPVNFDYDYDADGQLTEVQRDGVSVERYTYSPNRNRSSRQSGGNPAEAATYDGQDRLLQQGTLTYQFNADGYLTQRGADTFQFSTSGELLQAVVGGQTMTYVYDGLRRRVSRTSAAGTTQYLYGSPDNDLQVSNTRSPAGILTTYYYDDSRRLFAIQRGANRYYVASDQLGSPREIIDAAGAVVKVIEYDSAGSITLDSNPAFELAIGFAGGLADAATGLVRFGLRDYDPVAGRWTARDPAVFDGRQANVYAYVNNDPINLIDPVGFGTAGATLCEGVCVGLKLGYVPGEGISACFEAGFGVGNSLEVDPFADLSDNGLSTEAKFAVKAGIAKVEIGLDVPADPCGRPLKPKPKAEVCVGPLCAGTKNPGVKGKLTLDEEAKFKNPFKGSGLGATGKLVGKICQQAKW